MKSNRSYYRCMPGRKSIHFDECFSQGFIGVDFGILENLKDKLPDDWREFNAEYIPKFLEKHPDYTKIGAGLSCGFLWTLSKGVNENDVILVPNGQGQYAVGIITSGYVYAGEDANLRHQRRVTWLPDFINRSDMSANLRNSTGSTGTICNITKYASEIEALIKKPDSFNADSEDIEAPDTFALEKHLEDFLVQNWSHTELGKHYDIYEDSEGQRGEQYPTDTGPMDILAVSKDKKTLLVVELKRGQASDKVVGQILRYMGYAKTELCEAGQNVRGAIIALEDDQRLRRALSAVDNIDFYRYKISFKLERS